MSIFWVLITVSVGFLMNMWLILERSFEDIDIDSVECTRGFGRKRIAIRNKSSPNCLLESLPQELLVSVLCGVHHEDLGQLLLVSKTIKEAALNAKKLHFLYSTPRSKTKSEFKTEVDWEESTELDLAGVQNAPMGKRYMHKKLNREDFADIAVRLFDDEAGEEQE